MLALLLCFFSPSLLFAAPLTPDKDIKVVNKQAEEPLWKQWWDSARSLAQEQRYQEAIEKYHDVLKQKPQIEEVKWELCKVLVAIEDYQRASLLLESLLEADGNRIEYLLSAGEIALLENKSDHAITYFGQAFEQDPGGAYGDEALWGLIKSLKAEGKARIAIPLMEQLYLRGKVNPELLLDLARLTRDNDLLDKTYHYYSELIKKYRVEPSIFYEAADVFEKAGKIDASADLWQLYLENDPDYLPFHSKLADYYINHEESDKALPHLLVLIDNGVDLQSNLLLVARIYLFSLGRADKSLYFFEQYQRDFPDGEDVSNDITNLQLLLANDLLSIIENSGVWILWRDLALITPDRIGIYRAMAQLLEELGRENELLEVLQIINIHDPEDMDTILKLSSIYLKKKSYDACLLFLNNAEKRENLPALYFLLQAQCESGLKNDFEVLSAYEAYLEIKPGDFKTRVQAINLAGDIGLINTLTKLYQGKRKKAEMIHKSATVIEEVFIDNLIKNQLYTRAERELDSMAAKNPDDPARQLQIALTRSRILFLRGEPFEAERLLRQSAVDHPDSLDVILQLAYQALQKSDTAAASAWLKQADKMSKTSQRKSISAQQKSHLFYQYLLFDLLSGRGNEARLKADEYLQAKLTQQKLIGSDEEIVLFLAIEYYKAGKHDKSLELLKYYWKAFKASKKIPLLIRLITQKNGVKADAKSKESGLAPLENESISERLDSAELMIRLNKFSWALSILTEAMRLQPESVRPRILTAQTFFALSEYEKAWDNYYQLSLSLPGEIFFQEQLFRIEYLKWDTAGIIETFSLNEKEKTSTTDDISDHEQRELIVDKLFLARALWVDYQWDEALKIYDEIYFQLRETISRSMIQLEKIPEYKTFLANSFWGDLLFSPGDEEILDILMAPSYFTKHINTKTARITAALYATYRWHKIVKIERDAKTALNAREFYQAEKDYQELIEVDEDAGEEAYPDLATVYSRLGKNREETELLEKIKELKIDYPPVLKEAAERNVRQRQPHLLIDVKYRQEKGRKGFKDITQKYMGTSLTLMPTLSQEAGVWFARNEYGNSDSSTLAKSNFLLGQYSMHFNEFFQVGGAFGFEDFDTDGKSFIIYDMTLDAKLDEGIGVYATIKQAPVDDTIQSLADGVYRRDFRAGLGLEFLPSVFLGFDVNIMNYSDQNDGRLFNLWGSYRLFTERSSVDFSYNYEKLENSISNSDFLEIGPHLETGQLDYWSPDDYWKHFFSTEYKLELWPTGWLQSGTSYVSALYGLGYEKGDEFIQALELNILLEISPIFLVKGTFASQWSGDYDFQEAFVSLAYRW